MQVHLNDLVSEKPKKDIFKFRNNSENYEISPNLVQTEDVHTDNHESLPANVISENKTLSSNEKHPKKNKYNQLLTVSFENKVLSDEFANPNIYSDSFSNAKSDLNISSNNNGISQNINNEIYDPSDLVKHLNNVCSNLVCIIYFDCKYYIFIQVLL